jgi:molybdopterin converting factor subunit 1
MRVRVLFFGVLKDLVGRAEDALDVPSGSTLQDVFETYSERFETLRGKRSSILFARNQEFAAPGTLLADNDEVAFLPPVSGGSNMAAEATERIVLAIVRIPIDSQALARRLQRPEDGAVVVFEGVVRNNTKGRPTAYLDYEAYEPMALAQMKQIGQEILAEFELGRIGIVHRLGRLQIGEASVVIVATAPHRRPAFEAALKAIDRLKREAPIWKKEYFEDGAIWVDGEWDDSLLASSSNNAVPQ